MPQKQRRCLAAISRPRRAQLLLCAALLAALALAAPARAATLAVTKTADTNDGACNADCSLREAIVAANANPAPDTISLPAGAYSLTIAGADNTAAAGDLDIVGDLAITGASVSTTIVDGNSIDRVFEVISGTVTIANVTIRNGDAGLNGSGGGIANRAGAALTLVGSAVSGNFATFGAGIRSAGALTVTSSLIDGNSATQTGGGIVNVGSGTLALIDSTVSNNETAGLGGGIYNTGAARVTSSAIISNTANGPSTGAGGGIANYGVSISNNVVLAIVNSTLSGNRATVDGGGIYTILGTVRLSNTTIAGNTADSDANATGDGGGLMRIPDTGQVFLKNTLLAGNADSGGQAPDCATSKGSQSAQLTSQGYNLVQSMAGCDIGGDTTGNITGQPSGIAPLANNGGPTLSHALQAASPARDQGDPAGCTDDLGRPLAADQRGFPRPQGPRCDIGAYEGVAGGPPPAPPTIGKAFAPRTIVAGATSTLVFTLTNHMTATISGLAFADAMPAATQVAAAPPTNTCGGTLAATPGSSAIGLSGASLAASAACTIRVPVTSATPGSYTNTTGAVSANQTGAGAPSNSATLTVLARPPEQRVYLPIVRK